MFRVCRFCFRWRFSLCGARSDGGAGGGERRGATEGGQRRGTRVGEWAVRAGELGCAGYVMIEVACGTQGKLIPGIGYIYRHTRNTPGCVRRRGGTFRAQNISSRRVLRK